MEDSRLSRLEQQNSIIMTMTEGFIKKKEEHMDMMKKKMKMMEKNIDNLLSKKGFDVQKNEVVVQPFLHVEALIPQPNLTTTQFRHYSKIASSPPTIESQHKAIYKSATHRPTNPSLIEKIHQPHLLQKLYLVTHRATTISNPHRTVKENRRVQIWTLGDKVAFPFSERPPRKRMKGQR
jgi:hypothetical protein